MAKIFLFQKSSFENQCKNFVNTSSNHLVTRDFILPRESEYLLLMSGHRPPGLEGNGCPHNSTRRSENEQTSDLNYIYHMESMTSQQKSLKNLVNQATLNTWLDCHKNYWKRNGASRAYLMGHWGSYGLPKVLLGSVMPYHSTPSEHSHLERPQGKQPAAV